MVRRPKCLSGEVTIYEYFTICSSIFLSDGKCVGTIGGQSGNSQGRFGGFCDTCEHRWIARFKTGQEALAAAEIFEAEDI